MDRWIRKLKSVEIIDSPPNSRIIKYTNSFGDKIETYKHQVRISIGDKVTTLNLKDIKSVEMNPMFKYALEKPYITIRTEEENIRFLVDTRTDQFVDLPTVYDYIRRIVTVS